MTLQRPESELKQIDVRLSTGEATPLRLPLVDLCIPDKEAELLRAVLIA